MRRNLLDASKLVCFFFFVMVEKQGEKSDEPSFLPSFAFLSSLEFIPEEDFFSFGVVWCVFDAQGCILFGGVARE